MPHWDQGKMDKESVKAKEAEFYKEFGEITNTVVRLSAFMFRVWADALHLTLDFVVDVINWVSKAEAGGVPPWERIFGPTVRSSGPAVPDQTCRLASVMQDMVGLMVEWLVIVTRYVVFCYNYVSFIVVKKAHGY